MSLLVNHPILTSAALPITQLHIAAGQVHTSILRMKFMLGVHLRQLHDDLNWFLTAVHCVAYKLQDCVTKGIPFSQGSFRFVI